MTSDARHTIDSLYRFERAKVLATLTRLVGDLDLAEDAMQDAFAAALRQWPTDGVPSNPTAWLISAGRFKAIDTIRKRDKASSSIPENLQVEEAWSEEEIADDTLRLIFVCCHPALSQEGQVALTLREVCGLTTEEIAKSFLSAPSSIAQRIVRAKAKIRRDRIPFALPGHDELRQRLDAVLKVAYLVFNEGYYATSGYSLTRASLTAEAIRLTRLVADLLPGPEAFGLLALMLLAESRRASRVDAAGDVVLLADQDRSTWNKTLIEEGIGLARRSGCSGPYGIQAGIAAVHASSPSADQTDWAAIVSFYDRLLETTGSPVVQLNRAVAVAMLEGPEAGLSLIEPLLECGQLADYGLAHSARAELLRKLDRIDEASVAFRRALELTRQAPERRLLERRLDLLSHSIKK